MSMLWPDDVGWPQDIGALAILDGSRLLDSDGRFRIEAVRAVIDSRLRLVRRFRQLLYMPRRGLDWPLWVDAPAGSRSPGMPRRRHGRMANLAGPGFRAIAPSRFGYFGSTLPTDASPADQADAYAVLLDHLGVDRVVAMGFSAGSASVLELARRHAGRVRGLILASARLGGGVTANKVLAPVFRVAYGAERTFWTFKKLMPMTYARMMGAPKRYRPGPDEVESLNAIRELLFPLRPDGTVPSTTGSSGILSRTGPHSNSSRSRR